MLESFFSARGARRAAVLLAVALPALCAPPAHAVLNVTVSQVGFPTDIGDAVRGGAWAPVVVDISLEGQDSFDGTIRIGQSDIDGDLCFDRLELHLQGADTSVRRYLYTLPNPAQIRTPMAVEIFDSNGDVVEVVCNGRITSRCEPPGGGVNVLTDDEILLLSVSSNVRGKVEDLSKATDTLERRVAVAHTSPASIPEHWIGLEIVDIIVWDEADPDQLTPLQLEAMLEWARQGGTLLVAASRTAGKIAASDSLREAIPVTLGEVASASQFPGLRSELMGIVKPMPYREAIPYVNCKPRAGAAIIHNEEHLALPILTRRSLERGHVIFCAATLRDLFGEEGSPRIFFPNVLRMRAHRESASTPDGPSSFTPVSLFDEVVSAIGFTTSGSVYLLIAILFSLAYILTATFGTWAFLAAKGWKQHNWTAFALVAAAASALSVVGVKAVQGIGYTVHQLSIVDVDAGAAFGRGTGFFGIKSGADTTLDMWLPSNPVSDTEPGRSRCFLRPLPVSNDPLAFSNFADRDEYRLVPSNAVIEDVRLRATLKRLEGRWEGPVGGKLTASVTINKESAILSRISEDSWIANDLGVDLHTCFLLLTSYDIGPHAVNETQGDRASYIHAYPLGTIPAGGTKLALADLCYGKPAPVNMAEFVAKQKLLERQKEWVSAFTSRLSNFGFTGDSSAIADSEDKALMLLSTVGDMDLVRLNEAGFLSYAPRSISRDRLRQLDLRETLRRDCVYLVGFANGGGPMRLAHSRPGRGLFQPIEPVAERSRTMYRIRIPVTLVESLSANAPTPRAARPEEPENPDESDDPEVVGRRGRRPGS